MVNSDRLGKGQCTHQSDVYMEMKGNTIAIVLLVVGLIVGGGVGYFMSPSGTDEGTGGDGETQIVEKIPLDGQKIQVGYIVPTTATLETAQPLVKEIMEPDMNEYVERLGYDVEYEWLIDDAQGQAALHLEKVQGFKSMGVDVFIGATWSSMCQAALSYVNDNDMLMWSTGSTSPLLSIADDNFFRMCPTDLVQAPALSRMLESMGIKAVILIYRGDAWADGIVNIFAPMFEENGGVILEEIRYAGETTEFSNYLQTAENIAKDAVAEYGEGKVAVEVIAFAEYVTMITQAQDYPTLYSLPWFGNDGTVLSQQALDDAPEQAAHLKIYSTYAAPADTEKFNSLYDRFFSLVSQPFGYYSACAYDVGTLMSSTMLETQSTDAIDLVPLQRPKAYDQFGASGWNRLNEDGDRYASNYQIWAVNDEATSWEVYGMYNAQTDSVEWNTELLGFTPQGR
ncbi:ABC transporter substrate-binding protein [Candidatus Bathyarchaeota archaeon]|nr:ABC transporter substrate-binding protein [Candidatus Bathyarchaeota archaeon]